MNNKEYIVYICPKCKSQVGIEDYKNPDNGQTWYCYCTSPTGLDLEPEKLIVRQDEPLTEFLYKIG